MKKAIFLLLCGMSFGIAAAVHAQGLHATMFVKVVDAEPQDSLGAFFYPYKLKVIQDFDIRPLSCDTLSLKLENFSFFQTLRAEGESDFALIPDMNVCSRNGQAPYHDTYYTFDGANLSIPVPADAATHIRIEYGYYSDLCFRTHIVPMGCGLLQYDFGWNSWYFKGDDGHVEFDKVAFDIPDTVCFFINGESIAEADGTVSLDLAQHRYDDISFHIADKKWYDPHPVRIGDIRCDLLLSKRDTSEVENEIPVPLAQLPDSLIADRKERIGRIIRSLHGLFPESKAEEFTILEDDLRTEDEKYAYGRAVHMSDREHAVFIDRSYWLDPSLTHELVHCFLNYNYDRIDARYFFDESLIEYFANYVYYPDPNERDEAFAAKLEYFENLPGDKDISIFDISRNYVDTRSGDGTHGIVYHKVPARIHEFAQKIGTERFHEAVRKFNLRLEQGDAPDFEDFGRILMDSGVSEEDWLQFVRSI